MTSDVTEEIEGVSYKVFTVEGAGESENLIFHDNDGTQYDAFNITLNRDYFIVAESTSASEKL